MEQKHIDLLDSGSADQVPEDVQEDYKKIVQAMKQLGENELREELEAIHHKFYSRTNQSKRNIWLGAVAATIICLLTWVGLKDNADHKIIKSYEMPSYADSSSYRMEKDQSEPKMDIHKKDTITNDNDTSNLNLTPIK